MTGFLGRSIRLTVRCFGWRGATPNLPIQPRNSRQSENGRHERRYKSEQLQFLAPQLSNLLSLMKRKWNKQLQAGNSLSERHPMPSGDGSANHRGRTPNHRAGGPTMGAPTMTASSSCSGRTTSTPREPHTSSMDKSTSMIGAPIGTPFCSGIRGRVARSPPRSGWPVHRGLIAMAMRGHDT